MKASTATAEREVDMHYGNFLRAKIILMALDLASAVTTRLTAGGLAPRDLNVLFQVRLGIAGLHAPFSLGVSAVSSLDWARDPERVEGSRSFMNNAD